MKAFLKLFAIILLLQSSSCNDDNQNEDQTAQLAALQLKEQSIKDYIAGFSCDANSTCEFIAFGSKACGGPQEFLVFPSTVDLDYLTEKVNNYNALENAYNMTYGIVSDCMAVLPPENIGCVNGVCTILP